MLLNRVKNKIKGRRGTALLLAIIILALLTMISVCFAMAIPASYRIDYNTMKLEQATIYAKAGLNMTVSEIMKRADNSEGGQVEYLKALASTDGFTGVVETPDYNVYAADGTTVSQARTAQDVKCPETLPSFKITFEAPSDKIIKVVSTVEQDDIKVQVFRYIYYTAGTSNPFPPDAISCTDKVHVQSSVDGRIRAREVSISGSNRYRSVYAMESLVTNDTVRFQKVSNSSQVGMEGNVYSLKNIIFNSFIMEDSADSSKMGGTVASLGYIRVMSYGYGQPEALVAYGDEKYRVGSTDYAMYIGNSGFGYIGNPDIIKVGVCKNQSEVPVAIYSNGSCFISPNSDLTIYGNVFVNGDLIFDPTKGKKITIYGTVYVTGKIESAIPLDVKKWQTSDGVWLGSDTAISHGTDFAGATSNSSYLSEADIKDEVGDRNLRKANIPTLTKKSLLSFIGTDTGSGFTFFENNEVHSNGTDRYCVIRVNESCEITGTPTDLLDISRWDFSRSGNYKDSLDQPIRCNGGYYVLFLDASGLAEGEMLDVVISGDWYLTHSWYKPVRIYVNDNDGNNTVRLFLRDGTKLYIYNPQAYVPNSAVSNMTGINLQSNSLIPGTIADTTANPTVPRLFVFAGGALAYNDSYSPNPKIVDDASVMPEVYVEGGATFHGYILAPLSKFRMSISSKYMLVGKVCCGYFDASGWGDQGIVYKAPDEDIENAAIGGIFEGSSGSSTGGSFSLVG
jgi:hypothetical protein